MGLKDTVPDDVDTSSRGRGGRNKQDDEMVEIGSEPNKKVFTEDRFEKIKDVLRNDMGFMPEKVINNFPSNKRYEVLHEAALKADAKIKREQMEYSSPNRCIVCETACDQASVKIEGELTCPHHPVAKVRKSLDKKQNNENAETAEEK